MPTQVTVPSMGESVTQAILVRWLKADGQAVARDESLCELETDKANVDLPAPAAGVFHPVTEPGATVAVGEVIAMINETPVPAPAAAPVTSAAGTKIPSDPPSSKGPAAAAAYDNLSPAVRRLVAENHLDPAAIPATGTGGRLTAQDVESFLAKSSPSNGEKKAAPAPTPAPAPAPAISPAAVQPPKGKAAPKESPSPPQAPPKDFDARGQRRVKMSKIRLAIARRLVQAQQTAATATTYNEFDLTKVIELRSQFKQRFEEVHGVGLGFVSFFARACVLGLKEFPRLNACLDDDEIVYHRDVHMGIAVSTERGLAVPVLRNVQEMSLARIELEIKRLALATRDGKLGVDELSGGTFTITNGGVFGSLWSTPILNPLQSGILGMHLIQKRPVVINDKIEIRPMMYVALSYDHRLVDGSESVSFLIRIKQYVEEPARLMLEV